MLVLLVLCFCITCTIQIPENSGNITENTEGNTTLTCEYVISERNSAKFNVTFSNDQSWLTLEVYTLILKLNTSIPPSLLLPADGNSVRPQIYSCSADNRGSTVPADLNITAFDPGEDVRVSCNATKHWTSLSWSRDGEVIAVVRRGWCPMDIEALGNESFLFISDITIPEFGKDFCPSEGWLNITCSISVLQVTATGFQVFLEERYWIIVVTVLGYVLFCLLIMWIYRCIRRKRRSKERVKASFIKANASRNLYVESLNQDPDANLKMQELTYQNVTETLSKNTNNHGDSDKSSFLDQSFDGSYMEPDGGDQLSDDGDCYENACEEIKDGSVGSVSYEDMNGSICVGDTGETPGDGVTGSESYEDMQGSICIGNESAMPCVEEITQEDDADSYENMQTPVCSQLNPALKSQNKPDEEKFKDRPPCQHQWNGTMELSQQSGDFYISYESKKL
ncbi:B-lymphocyte antigen CD19-like [Pseudophryne corroboree]|uniref:B-lymphocyte antigen CD19-like n=1 Tax=Pseudophryne corroboree TaxID=495146 RepID=UPI003081320D